MTSPKQSLDLFLNDATTSRCGIVQMEARRLPPQSNTLAAKPEVQTALLRCLKDPDFFVRCAAIEALARRLGEQAVRDSIRECLKDPDWWVRCAAIDALAQHAGEPRSEDCQSGPQGQSSQ